MKWTKTGVSIFECFLAVFVLFTFFSSPSVAEFTHNEVVSTLIGKSFPTRPMKAGVWELSVTPTYFSFDPKAESSNDADINGSVAGFGGAVALSYYFSPQLGISFLGGSVSGDGEGIVRANSGSTGQAMGIHEYSGYLVGAYLVLDPYSDPEGFRLPFFIGAGFAHYFEKIAFKASPDVDRREIDRDKVVVGAGIAPQFKLFKNFRISPFVLINKPLDSLFTEKRVDMVNAGEFGGRDPSENPHAPYNNSFGINFTFLPWNLSSQLSMGTVAGISIYTLSWAKRWD